MAGDEERCSAGVWDSAEDSPAPVKASDLDVLPLRAHAPTIAVTACEGQGSSLCRADSLGSFLLVGNESDTDTDAGESVEAIIDDIIADFAHVLPQDLCEETRELILDALAAHPNARLLGARLAPRAAPERSGTEAIDGESEDQARKAGGKK
jgi:hypothetical protein